MLTDPEIRRRLDALSKPPGSLGRLEDLAARLCGIQGTLRPRTSPRRLVLFAADHGVVAAGVSAWPSTITASIVANILAGGAASSVLARSTGTDLQVVDVGILGPVPPPAANFCSHRVRSGTRNLAIEPALTLAEFEEAFAVGETLARAAADDGMAVVAAGEMGIGNSTPAACLTALLTGLSPADVVGRGAGADDACLERKRAVVAGAVGRARPLLLADPKAAMAAVGGLEIAAMAGFIAAAVRLRLTVVLDGFIATAAALVADRLAPGTPGGLIAAHRAAEPGHSAALAQLALYPFLDGWQMRLGEGTGALLLMPLLDAAAAIVADMATLESLGIATHA